jgi:hypothetical protein
MSTATIKIFLVHGDPQRLRTAEISGWTGKAVVGPRSELEEILKREEAEKTGIYLLIGRDIETGKSIIYIGKADTIRDRVKSHISKDFWNHVIFFTSANDGLTSAHALYLEGQLIARAIELDHAIVQNKQESGAKLPESDRADMNMFLSNMYQLLPILNVDVFVPKYDKIYDHNDDKPKAEILFCDINELRASGYRTPNGFLVQRESQAVATERASASNGIKKQRADLIAQGVLSLNDSCLTFTKDFEFSSPSGAASLIRGGNSNGLVCWKNAQGMVLRDIETKESEPE